MFLDISINGTFILVYDTEIQISFIFLDMNFLKPLGLVTLTS